MSERKNFLNPSWTPTGTSGSSSEEDETEECFSRPIQRSFRRWSSEARMSSFSDTGSTSSTKEKKNCPDLVAVPTQERQVDKMKNIIAREISYDSVEVFAKILGVNHEYNEWTNKPFRSMYTMQLKVDYIIDTWKKYNGRSATPEAMSKKLGENRAFTNIKHEFDEEFGFWKEDKLLGIENAPETTIQGQAAGPDTAEALTKEDELKGVSSRILSSLHNNISETISIRRGESRVFLRNNCKIELDPDNENEEVEFEAEFTADDKLRQILDLMKEKNIIPCGPVVYLYNLADTRSKLKLDALKATLSLRHYMYLPEKSGFLGRTARSSISQHDNHTFVSFSEHQNVMAMKMHNCEEQGENSASVKITKFSHWCFASWWRECNHQFPMDICILRPIGSSCPHEKSQVNFVATGTRRRVWREANEQEKMWDDPDCVEREFEEMCQRKKLELAAERVEICLPSCYNEYETEVGMKTSTKRNAPLQWDKCGEISIQSFIFSNRNGISLPMHMKKRNFPFPNCETASHVDNYPYIRLFPKQVPDPEGWGEWIASKFITSPVKTGGPSELFTEEGFSIYIQDDNKCPNQIIPEHEKPQGIAFVIGNSYQGIHNLDTLTTCPTNAKKFEEYLEETLLNLKYHWHVEPKRNVSKDEFETLLEGFSKTALANKTEAICFYFSGHGICLERVHYLIMEDGEKISVDEIQEKVVNIFKSVSPSRPKFFIFVLDVCRNIVSYSIQDTPAMVVDTNSKDTSDHIFALWSTQRGDEANEGEEESTFSKLLLSELRAGTQWNQLASKINETYQSLEGLYCSSTSSGTGFNQF